MNNMQTNSNIDNNLLNNTLTYKKWKVLFSSDHFTTATHLYYYNNYIHLSINYLFSLFQEKSQLKNSINWIKDYYN